MPRRRRSPNRPQAAGIADVARVAGVSTATVSRTLVTPERVRPKTRDAVMAAVASTGYTPNQAARQLRARKSMMAMVITPTVSNLFFPEVIRGIDGALSAAGYGLIIGNLDNKREREAHFVDLAFSGQVDGVLLMNGWMPTKDGRSLADTGLPIVALSAAIEEAEIPQVIVQDYEAAREAAAHLVGFGHRQLGYLSGPKGNWHDRERWRGFCDGAADTGVDPATILHWQGDFTFRTGTTTADDFLGRAERPTGIFAASDEMAIAFMKRIQQAGLSVPEDISVIGFDGIEFSHYCEPTLTTIHQPRHEMGRIGANMLLSMMGSGDNHPPEWTRMPVPLIPRNSTGPVALAAENAQRRSA